MKIFIYAAFFWIIVILPNPCRGIDILYDDFSAPYLDGNKWWPREYVREVTDGKLVFKLGNSTGMGAEAFPGMFFVELPIANPETKNSIEAEVKIKEIRLDSSSDSRSFARIAGYFYNMNETGGATGDILAMITIGDRGNGGLEAYWEVMETLTDESNSWSMIRGETLIEPGALQYDTPYKLKLSYTILTTGEGQFLFEAHDQSVSFEGPQVKRGPVKLFKALTTAIFAENSSDDGFIHAEFDNVYVNNDSLVYDDFSFPLDLSKWEWLEWVREPYQGSLKVQIQREGSTGGARTYTVGPDTSFIQAKVRLNSESVFSPGGWGEARLRGNFYNESRGPGSGLDYNVSEGDVFAKVNLQADSNGVLKSTAYIQRSDNVNSSSATILFFEEFTTPIHIETDYVLSIRFQNNQLIFKCDNETLVYQIDTPRYSPYPRYHRGLETRLYLDPGESGYMKAFFDDVWISDNYIVFCLQDYDFDNDMDGSDILAFITDAKGVGLDDFSSHFGRTDCP